MKLIWVLAILCLVGAVISESDAAHSEKTAKKDTLGQVLKEKLRGASAMQVVDLVQKVAHRSTGNTIVDRGQGRGFSLAGFDVSRSSGTVERGMLPELLGVFLLQAAKLPEETMAAVKLSLLEVALQTGGADFETQHFHFDFTNGNGEIVFLYLGLRPGREPGTLHYIKGALNGKFALASDYVVMRHSRKRILSDKTWDEIVYIPRGVTDEEIVRLISHIHLPTMQQLEAAANEGEH